MSMYIQLDDDNRLIAYTNSPFNPDEEIWIEFDLPDDVIDHFYDYLLVDGNLVYEKKIFPIPPVKPEDVICAIIEAQQDILIPAIPDSMIEHISGWFPMWSGYQHEYSVGNIVNYDNVLYKCLIEHTSIITWTPPASPSLWAKVLTDPSGDILPWIQPDSTNPYMKGDRVLYNGGVWESTIDNNVWEPGVYGWILVEEN